MRVKEFFAGVLVVLSRRNFDAVGLNSTASQTSPGRLQGTDSAAPTPTADGRAPEIESRTQAGDAAETLAGLQAEALIGVALGAGLAFFGLPTNLNWWVRALLALLVFIGVTFIFGRFPCVPRAVFKFFTQRGISVMVILVMILAILLMIPAIEMTAGLRAALVAGGAATLSEIGELLAFTLQRRGHPRLSPRLVLVSLPLAFLIGGIGCIVVRQFSTVGVEVTTPVFGAALAGLAIRAVTVTLARYVPPFAIDRMQVRGSFSSSMVSR